MVSLALSAGKSVRWVAAADPSVTLRVYAHALPADAEDLGFLAAPNFATNSDQTLVSWRAGMDSNPNPQV
jgi:hypothetical protein